MPPDPLSQPSWYACPICGERLPLPVDTDPQTGKELDWIWLNVAIPLARKAAAECRWSERVSHA